MSESTTSTTELTSQYIARVTDDLEHNLKEQERVGAEITALQEQLTALQQDHTVLVNVQQALGITKAPAESAVTPESTAVPSPRQNPSAEPSGRRRARKATAAQASPAARKPAAKKPAAKTAPAAKTTQPTLVELIRRHLTEQSEPRSAAEISATLDQAHPERGIKTKVVRVTLEGLVAKSQAQRTKQGSSVFYTAPDAPEPAVAPQAEEKPEGTDS
ncbi:MULTISPECIES: hypothetical protein [Streptomyces]|uniref:hypothetical protein n=1 Tax=Streptomyces TaxID=1883 RepID=UPI0007481464|nr:MULTISPECIES: hypothetical protein [Streptomyces]KUM68081.1 hypothetical protein AQI84_38745 [Streptomyces griseorubiginosus]KUO07203.1 hypothetical protein AQJ58_36295 [Streptomyces sp. DSM 15324]